PTQWSAAIGTYTLKVWTSNINGNADMNASNDTITKTIEIGPGIPNIIDDYVGVTPIITQIGNSSDQIATPSDLDFHPALSNKQLWVVNKGHSNNTSSGGSSMVIFDNAGEASQTSVYKKDGNAKHFMNSTTGIAFSKNGNWANSPGVYDANFNGSVFTGPALWSGDLNIFAITPPGGNGSHLDMLHESPYSQGIASESGNAFWVFDGNYNDIVRYDFVNDHGPGNTYHDDGIVHRYRTQTVTKDPNNKVGSHLAISDGWVYVVDYGNQRIFRIQMGTGNLAPGSPVPTQKETLAEYKDVINYTTEMVVTSGLVEPCGIDIVEDRMIVSDYSTGEIIIYDITIMPAVELDRLSTGAMGIMGIKIGPLGKIWYVDYDANTVNRIDGATVSVEEIVFNDVLSVYPNPAKNNFSINLKGVFNDNINVKVYDLTGKLIYNTVMKNNTLIVNTEKWTNGIYQVHLSNNTQFSTEKIVIQH
ncbi:MAG: T9SS type A sorting domain-containing protein, partial [Flavobacteriales bacterium]|nr:T9SS type A sorting domain-containing protein [Flavobacteriales bacterium]